MIAVLLLAGIFAANAESSLSPRVAAQRRAEDHVESEKKRLDGRFLCLRLLPTGPYVVIVITSAEKRAVAEEIIRRINLSPSTVEVRDPAQYEREGIALRKRIAAEKQRYNHVEVSWPGVYNGGSFDCAEVQLLVLPHASARALKWARETVRHYGDQRVELQYVRETTPV